ncbi:hypothetical protein WMY93_008072 [Mugilogobius chulae]|uniref:Clu domain-containing protein n=1 Tax=Mugilogobius chulae TaxID=88201 RepID=A0AAW0PRE6_9GOBI
MYELLHSPLQDTAVSGEAWGSLVQPNEMIIRKIQELSENLLQKVWSISLLLQCTYPKPAVPRILCHSGKAVESGQPFIQEKLHSFAEEKTAADFTAAASQDAESVVDGNAVPLNPGGSPLLQMWNTMFFSLGFDQGTVSL